jgi:hypothetical protein
MYRLQSASQEENFSAFSLAQPEKARRAARGFTCVRKTRENAGEAETNNLVEALLLNRRQVRRGITPETAP